MEPHICVGQRTTCMDFSPSTPYHLPPGDETAKIQTGLKSRESMGLDTNNVWS